MGRDLLKRSTFSTTAHSISVASPFDSVRTSMQINTAKEDDVHLFNWVNKSN